MSDSRSRLLLPTEWWEDHGYTWKDQGGRVVVSCTYCKVHWAIPTTATWLEASRTARVIGHHDCEGRRALRARPRRTTESGVNVVQMTNEQIHCRCSHCGMQWVVAMPMDEYNRRLYDDALTHDCRAEKDQQQRVEELEKQLAGLEKVLNSLRMSDQYRGQMLQDIEHLVRDHYGWKKVVDYGTPEQPSKALLEAVGAVCIDAKTAQQHIANMIASNGPQVPPMPTLVPQEKKGQPKEIRVTVVNEKGEEEEVLFRHGLGFMTGKARAGKTADALDRRCDSCGKDIATDGVRVWMDGINGGRGGWVCMECYEDMKGAPRSCGRCGKKLGRRSDAGGWVCDGCGDDGGKGDGGDAPADSDGQQKKAADDTEQPNWDGVGV